MADVWPNDVFRQAAGQGSNEPLRPFHCVLLMPFAPGRFEALAREMERIVRDYTTAVLLTIQIGEAKVERLVWVDSAGAVQTQLWDRIANADLVFCDLTGQNPNVMFEAGVSAAQKRIEQVIFLRDVFYRPDQPFDIAPFRYIQYQFTSDGVPAFEKSIRQALEDVVIQFPDREMATAPPTIKLPLEIDFAANRDDHRLVIAPLAHRRVRSGQFEFGSLWSFPHSWATIGKTRFSTFTLEFDATFAKLHPNRIIGTSAWVSEARIHSFRFATSSIA